MLASDRQNDGDVLAMNGASAALRLSPLPFHGPIGSVRLASINGEFVPFPTHDALEESDLDLIVSGSKESILMIEGFAREMPEDRMVEAIALAHSYIREICEMQEELAAKVGTVKKEYDGAAARRRLIETLRSEILRRLPRRQADRGQAGPGRSLCRGQEAGASPK